ncbi:MAG: hypothetical protein Q7T05_08375 [Dehalococcoidia bacterium]|nr:hypothetical protein [Dehalococcoidia bacterium]
MGTSAGRAETKVRTRNNMMSRLTMIMIQQERGNDEVRDAIPRAIRDLVLEMHSERADGRRRSYARERLAAIFYYMQLALKEDGNIPPQGETPNQTEEE